MVTLTTLKTYPGKPYSIKNSADVHNWIIRPVYEITPEAIAAFCKSNVVMVRIYYEATHIDYQVTPEPESRLKKAALMMWP